MISWKSLQTAYVDVANHNVDVVVVFVDADRYPMIYFKSLNVTYSKRYYLVGGYHDIRAWYPVNAFKLHMLMLQTTNGMFLLM